jgi:hypothetical protein
MDWTTLLESLACDEPRACEVCAATGTQLRRGRCPACYARWAETRPVGLGATCALCGERRRSCLKQVELGSTWTPLCGNCAVRAARVEPHAESLLALRLALWPPHADDRRGLTRGAVGTDPGGEIRVDEHPELVLDLDEWDLPVDVDWADDRDETRIVIRA